MWAYRRKMNPFASPTSCTCHHPRGGTQGRSGPVPRCPRSWRETHGVRGLPTGPPVAPSAVSRGQAALRVAAGGPRWAPWQPTRAAPWVWPPEHRLGAAIAEAAGRHRSPGAATHRRRGMHTTRRASGRGFCGWFYPESSLWTPGRVFAITPVRPVQRRAGRRELCRRCRTAETTLSAACDTRGRRSEPSSPCVERPRPAKSGCSAPLLPAASLFQGPRFPGSRQDE